jgi:hypothetical protein
MRKTIFAVLTLAMVSFFTSLVILVSPLGSSGTELSARATLSGAVSGVFGVILGIIAIIVASRVSSSDYKAEEDVKAKTAELLACLRSIIIKAIALTQTQPDTGRPVTFTREKDTLNKFLNSTTGFAYWSWAGDRSEAAQGKPEEWRVFFLRFFEILNSDDASDYRKMIPHAFAIEEMLTALSKRDMLHISGYVSDLSGAIGGFRQSRETDTLVKAAWEVYGRKDNPTSLRDKLLYLKNEGVNDPTLDLFLEVMDPAGGSPEKTKAALDAGADVAMTDVGLLKKYDAQLRNYVASDK